MFLYEERKGRTATNERERDKTQKEGKIMNKEKIMNEVSERVKMHMEEGYVVRPITITKNNGVERHGFQIGREGDKLMPTIYLNEDQFDGEVSEIAYFIEHSYREIKDQGEEFSGVQDLMQNKEAVLKHINYAIINKEKNERYLKHVPHKEFLDLALVYKVYLPCNQGLGTITMSYDLMKLCDVSLEELEEAANRHFYDDEIECFPISDVLRELFGESEAYETEDSLYVLKSNVTGAAVLANIDVLANVAERLDSDLCIFPSSIYEVIVMRVEDKKACENEYFKNMVEEVNANEVEAQEVLSNSVYYFDRNEKKLEIAQGGQSKTYKVSIKVDNIEEEIQADNMEAAKKIANDICRDVYFKLDGECTVRVDSVEEVE